MSEIEWCDETWQVVSGCTPVTEGCRNCYSARLCGTRLKHNPRTAGLARKAGAAPDGTGGRWVFTGEVRCHEDQLAVPLAWRRPKRIFVADRGDLFHADVPDAFIDRVFAVMALCPRHTFMVLTKRPERMKEYFYGRRSGDPWAEAADHIADLIGQDEHPAVLEPNDIPLPNVWLGVSVENQATADARVPELLATPAAVRFVSYEPALGPVDFSFPDNDECYCDIDARAFFGVPAPGVLSSSHAAPCPHHRRIDQVIFGGESGPGKRPVDLAWARNVRDQCAAAGAAFFMKQVDKVQPIPADLDIRQWPAAAGASEGG